MSPRVIPYAWTGVYTAQGPEVLQRLLEVAGDAWFDPVRERRDDGVWVRVGMEHVFVADPVQDLAGDAP